MKNRITFLLFSFCLFSCETVVNVDLPVHEPKLVMNSFINPDSLFSIQVSNSLSILDNGTIKSMENAVVEIYENGSLIETLQYSANGKYNSASKYPVVGSTYKINVSANGYDDISSTAVIPTPVLLSSTSLKDSAFSDNHGSTLASLSFTFNDPSNKNYYMAEVFEIDTAAIDTNNFYFPENRFNYYYIFSDDPAAGESQYGSSILFSDEFFNGKSYQLTVKFDSYYLNSNPDFLVYARLSSVSEEFYLYKKTLASHQQNKNNPFAEPVQVYNNVKNGFGIFAGYSSHSFQVR